MKGPIYLVTLTKETRKKPNPQRIKAEVDELIGLGLGTKTRKRDWSTQIHDSTCVKELGTYTIVRKVAFQRVRGQRRSEASQWTIVYNKLAKACHTSGRRWSITSPHAPKEAPPAVHIHVKDDVKDYAPINLDMGKHFSHIFDRERQIRRIMAALRLAQQTNMQKRLHCVLFGEPGCGKSEIIAALGKMLGEERKHYIQFDATSTTQAGAINIFLSSPNIPPVLLVEEIEKTHQNDQRWMLGLLDQRAEIRQVNFRVGNRAKNVKVLCIATCNDLQLFKSVMSGALASRFTHKIMCPRPTREILQKILTREVSHIPGGKTAWITPALDFADELHITDPREVISICLSGQDDLLTKQYQSDYRATTEQ
ncbi:MAG: ATP-binding protein [Proteobacteria bacterium]|jgi:hypothetical protein|nr:ATP-binding protein [Pseudomonadota bacterium]